MFKKDRSFFSFRNGKKKISALRAVLVLLIFVNLGFIWFNSSQVSDNSNEMSNSVTKSVAPHVVKDFDKLSTPQKEAKITSLNSIIRECAHTAEFVPLGFLILMLILSCLDFEVCRGVDVFWLTLLCTLPAIFIMALSDEVHQIFVKGRAFQLADIGLDMLGSLGGYALGMFFYFLHRVLFRRNKVKIKL